MNKNLFYIFFIFLLTVTCSSPQNVKNLNINKNLLGNWSAVSLGKKLSLMDINLPVSLKIFDNHLFVWQYKSEETTIEISGTIIILGKINPVFVVKLIQNKINHKKEKSVLKGYIKFLSTTKIEFLMIDQKYPLPKINSDEYQSLVQVFEKV